MLDVFFFISNTLQVLWTKDSLGSVSGYSTIPELLEETRVRFIKWLIFTQITCHFVKQQAIWMKIFYYILLSYNKRKS